MAEQQNQTNNKQELLKQLETVMVAYTNMMWAFKNAIMEKETQIATLQKQIDQVKGEIEKETSSESKVA